MRTLSVLRQPSSVRIHTESGNQPLRGRSKAGSWSHKTTEVSSRLQNGRLMVYLQSPDIHVMHVELRWQQQIPENLQYLGDHWERGYGDMAWTGMAPDKPMPWYFIIRSGTQTCGYGVKTGAGAFCRWHVDPHGVTLWLDVRAGGVGVQLGDRRLEMATVIERVSQEWETPYETISKFVAQLCDKPLLPKQPVYGANNFYYAYGENYNCSQDQVLRDSQLVSDLASNSSNRPYSVIDMGWESHEGNAASDWCHGNDRFPDMAALAQKLKKSGVRPGLWYRPLLASADVPVSWTLDCRRAFAGRGECILDPTVPDVLHRIHEEIELMNQWGYELIKYDCTTHDILGRWGGMMGGDITESGWRFSDSSRTNAEVLIRLYQTIREAAGDSLLVGCNTVGHLCAGYIHVQRIGDNTSGREWPRTRQMGVNSLAFRALQHGALFATDADCVGLTEQIPWRLNQQWLELLASSGTPLFISAKADSLKEKERQAIGRAYDRASREQPLIQPVDWMQNACPARWKSGEEFFEFNWWAAS
jgi:alpha-galactosidase